MRLRRDAALEGDPELFCFQAGDFTTKNAMNLKSSEVSCLCALCVLWG